MIPETWLEEEADLVLKMHSQRERRYQLIRGEKKVTDEDIIKLRDKVATPDELKTIKKDARGEYRDGDTRGWIMEQEDRCQRMNCWMIRHPEEGMKLISEPPEKWRKRNAEALKGAEARQAKRAAAVKKK